MRQKTEMGSTPKTSTNQKLSDMQDNSFQESMTVIRSVIIGAKTHIIARKAKVSVQTVRNALNTTATSYIELPETQKHVVDVAMEYIGACKLKQDQLKEITKQI